MPQPPQSSPEKHPAKPGNPLAQFPLTPTRIAALVVLALALLLMGLECRTRAQWSGTKQAISGAMANPDKGLYRKGLRKYLRGAPSRKKVGQNAEIFTWDGLVKSYRMRLEYKDSGLVNKAAWY